MKTQNKIYSTTVLFFIFVIACMAIDVFEAWARVSDVALLRKISCSVHPFLVLANPLLSNQIINFVNYGCLIDKVGEPLYSIIFYMIKLNFAVAIFIPYWLYVLLFFNDLLSARNKKFQEFAEPGNIVKSIKATAILALACLGTCTYLAMGLTLNRTPDQYFARMRFVKIFETVTAGTIFLCMIFITFTGYFISSYFWSKRKSGNILDRVD